MKARVRVLSSKRIYDGRVVRLRLDRVVEPGGDEATREIVEHHGSVVVIPRLPNGNIVMVRQYRYATQGYLWELVAGSMDPGESVIRAARRELQEETGYRARSLNRLFSIYPSPGFLTEKMHLVEARDLTLVEASPEDDERIEVAEFSKIQLDKLLRQNKITDGKTLAGLLWDRWKVGVGNAKRNR
ncbi:MAG TPA: NUDIX hydrolase [Terriglobia bacterium]|nr:NUDIX hydrolase [Terriglobia bacterium]